MKSYKDLPREVVLNAPEVAMFFYEETNLFYKYDHGFMFAFLEGTWNQCATYDLNVWIDRKVIPLPNVKIPWEAKEDSVCPVPGYFNLLVWINGYQNHQTISRMAENWRWDIVTNKITDYQIIDEDFMRKESADHVNGKEFSICSTENSIDPIVILTEREQLIGNLEFLQYLHERFPTIADCAKSAMERLVEKWVELN